MITPILNIILIALFTTLSIALIPHPYNKDEVFYLMSKGINKENAEKLIIQGYLLSVIDNEELKTKIREYLNSRR